MLSDVFAKVGEADVALSVITLIELAHGAARANTPDRKAKREQSPEERGRLRRGGETDAQHNDGRRLRDACIQLDVATEERATLGLTNAIGCVRKCKWVRGRTSVVVPRIDDKCDVRIDGKSACVKRIAFAAL